MVPSGYPHPGAGQSRYKTALHRARTRPVLWSGPTWLLWGALMIHKLSPNLLSQAKHCHVRERLKDVFLTYGTKTLLASNCSFIIQNVLFVLILTGVMSSNLPPTCAISWTIPCWIMKATILCSEVKDPVLPVPHSLPSLRVLPYTFSNELQTIPLGPWGTTGESTVKSFTFSQGTDTLFEVVSSSSPL